MKDREKLKADASRQYPSYDDLLNATVDLQIMHAELQKRFDSLDEQLKVMTEQITIMTEQFKVTNQRKSKRKTKY